MNQANEMTTSVETGKQAAIGCLETIRQCETLVRAIDDETYCKNDPGASSIGAHMRHCVEHLLEFVKGTPNGEIHYDSRERNPEMEVNRMFLLEKLADVDTFITDLNEEDLSGSLLVYLVPCRGASPEPMISNVTRELAFLSSHNIHHIALMKLLARLAGVDVQEDLGVAYSTENHRHQTG